MSDRAGRYEVIYGTQVIFSGLVIAGLILAGIAPALADGETQGAVESRGMPQLQRPMQPGSPARAGALGQPNAQLPTFPQKFEVHGPEWDTFGFAVTQPGPVVVEVQSQGAPVIAILRGPGPQPIQQQGTGNFRLTYNVTPQDVQKGVFWGVSLRLAQQTPTAQGGRAAGTVMVQHPPVNQAAVQQAVALASQPTQPTPQELQQAAQDSAQMEQAFQQRKAQFEQQQQQRRAALHAQIQPQIDQLRARMGGQVRSRGLEETEGASGAPEASSEGEIGTRALRQAGTLLPQAPTITSPQVLQPVPQTGTSSQAVTAAGSGPPPAQVAVNPTITSLSVAQGQPGDPVMITGSGFGTGGEVHFVIAPGKDLMAPSGGIWGENQIFVTVPDAAGVVGFNGQLYIKRAADQKMSNLTGFRFEPALELREVYGTPDVQMGEPGTIQQWANRTSLSHDSLNPFWGFKGNDRFFVNTRLKNGWVMENGFVIIGNMRHAGAYVQETKVNTDWPYLDVRWWVDGCLPVCPSYNNYRFRVVIRGPKGVPDGIVVP